MRTSKELKLKATPLQRVLGFDVAEEIYDLLPFEAQLIIDCKIEGYTEKDIAEAMGLAQQRVSEKFLQARQVLLTSKLHLILESRQYYREITPIVMEEENDERR